MTLAIPKTPLRPEDPENVAFLADKSQFGKGMLSYTHYQGFNGSATGTSTMLTRQQGFVSCEERALVAGKNRKTGKPYSRWQQKHVLLLKIKNGTLQTFTLRKGKTRNTTTVPSLDPFYGGGIPETLKDEVIALAGRNGLKVGSWAQTTEALLLGLAYPPLQEVSSQKSRGTSVTVVPRCLTDLLRSQKTVADVMQHVTNNPELELRELLRAYLQQNQPLSAEALFSLLWVLTTSRGILSREERFHLVAGHLLLPMEPRAEYNRWLMLRSNHDSADFHTKFLPDLKGQRRLRNFMKRAKQEFGTSTLLRVTGAVLHHPRDILHLLDGFQESALLRYFNSPNPPGVTDDTWSSKYLILNKNIPIEGPTEDSADLEKMMRKLASTGLLSLEEAVGRVVLRFENYAPEAEQLTRTEELIQIWHRGSEAGKKGYRKSAGPNVYTYKGLGQKYAANEGQYPRPILEQSTKMWSKAEEVLDNAGIPLESNTIVRVFVWLALNEGNDPPRRVLRLAPLSLSLPVFLRLTQNRQSVAEARDILAGLPNDLAIQLVK